MALSVREELILSSVGDGPRFCKSESLHILSFRKRPPDCPHFPGRGSTMHAARSVVQKSEEDRAGSTPGRHSRPDASPPAALERSLTRPPCLRAPPASAPSSAADNRYISGMDGGRGAAFHGLGYWAAGHAGLLFKPGRGLGEGAQRHLRVSHGETKRCKKNGRKKKSMWKK